MVRCRSTLGYSDGGSTDLFVKLLFRKRAVVIGLPAESRPSTKRAQAIRFERVEARRRAASSISTNGH
jgi:hypothetical protein